MLTKNKDANIMDNGSHLERIELGVPYYDMLAPEGPLTSRTVEFRKPGSQQVAPESTSEYRVFFLRMDSIAPIWREGANNPTTPPSCGWATDDIRCVDPRHSLTNLKKSDVII
jgi:hypothetical protein